MKAVMISIQPKWCELIANGEKTIEVRKTRPKIDTPFKCYIYATKSKRDEIRHVVSYSFRSGIKFDVGKVIGEFICDRIEGISKVRLGSLGLGEFEDIQKSCLTEQQIYDYCQEKDIFYMWHISDLKIHDTPKELGDFYKAFEYDNEGFLNCTKNSDVICQSKQDSCKYSDCEILQQLDPKITKPPQSWQYCEELEEK